MGGLKVNSCIDIALLFRICKYKVLKYIQSEVTEFQSKAYQAASRMYVASATLAILPAFPVHSFDCL